MKCSNCGGNLEERDVFCPNCGTEVQYNTNSGSAKQQQKPQTKVQESEAYYKKRNRQLAKIVLAALLIPIIFIIIIVVSAFVYMFSTTENIMNDVRENMEKQEEIDNGFGNNSSNSSSSKNNNSSTTTVSNNKNSTYKINCNGFKFYIPNNLECEKQGDTMCIINEDDEWMLQTQVQEGAFSKVKKNKNTLYTSFVQYFAEDNIKVSTPKEEKINGVEYILLDCNDSDENMSFVVGYAKLNSMYTMVIMLFNSGISNNTDVLKDLSEIINSAEYVGDSEYMKDNEDIDMSELTKSLESVLAMPDEPDDEE